MRAVDAPPAIANLDDDRDSVLETVLGAYRMRVEITAEVERLFDAKFTLSGHLGVNLPIDMGKAAVLRVGDVRLVVTERSGPHFAPELFRSAGLDPFAALLVTALLTMIFFGPSSAAQERVRLSTAALVAE